MFMNRKRIITSTVAAIALIFVTVLGYNLSKGYFSSEKSDGGTSSPGIVNPQLPSTPNYDTGNKGSESPSVIVNQDKTIGTYYFNMETKEFEKVSNDLNMLITKYNGYVENSNVYYGGYYDGKKLRTGQFTFRIPKAQVLAYNAELKLLANVVSETSSKTNVSKTYTDTESRLNALKIKEERMLALYEKAERIEDIIAIESQLSSIFYEKEQLTLYLKDLDDRIDYSYVTVQLQEVEKLTTEETVETTFAERLAAAFKDSIYFFTSAVQNFVIWLVLALPYILIAAVALVIGLKVYRGRRKEKAVPPEKKND